MPRDVRRDQATSELSPASAPWYEEMPAVSAEVECGGDAHRITWRRGKLLLEDHDLLAERSLAALGGAPPMCLQVLDAWRSVRNLELVPELLVRDTRQSPDLFASMRATHEGRMRRAQGIAAGTRTALQGPPQGPDELSRLQRIGAQQVERETRRWQTTLIRGLPPALKRMLALSMLAHAERHWDEEEFRREHARHIEPALTAIAAPLFEQSARRWKRNFKPYARIVAETSLLEPGEQPKCTARASSEGAHAELALPISWFTDIWARGIALVNHYFVMGRAEATQDGSRLHVFAIRWERQGWENSRSTEAPAVVSLGFRGDWRLHWL